MFPHTNDCHPIPLSGHLSPHQTMRCPLERVVADDKLVGLVHLTCLLSCHVFLHTMQNSSLSFPPSIFLIPAFLAPTRFVPCTLLFMLVPYHTHLSLFQLCTLLKVFVPSPSPLWMLLTVDVTYTPDLAVC